jgi:steroid delta-isomerase-like uncharacterized protein
MNNGNWGIIDEAFSADFIYHGPFGMETRGLADFKRLMAEVMTAFPDFQMNIEDVIAEENKLSVRMTNRCTHSGNFMDRAPSGKQAVFTGVIITHIVNGKRAESWDIWDTASFLQQLGISPSADR